MIWFFVTFTVLITLVRVLKGFEPKVASNDGAIIMATGILINGAVQKIPALASSVGPYAAVALLSLLLWLGAEYVRDIVDGSFYERHLYNPIQSFALGTWIAALSVTTVAFVGELPAFRPLAVSLFLFAVALNCVYIFLVIANYIQLVMDSNWIKKVNGIILLGCVANQSLVIAGNNLYAASFPKAASLFLMGLGFLFYILGIVALLLGYKGERLSYIVENWANTNTLIHGAISITGLAFVSSQLNAPNIAAIIWLISLILLIAVEGLDILRAVKRLRNLGLKKGILVYQSSQWARIFTLGMFLAFSIKLPLKSSFLQEVSGVSLLYQGILSIGPYLVIILFLFEVLLSLSQLIEKWHISHS